MYRIYLTLLPIFYLITDSNSVSIEVFGVGECDKPIDGDIKLSTDFKSESPKSIDITVDIPYDIEGDDEFHLDVHQLTEGEWSMYAKEFDGDICTYLEEFLSGAWGKMKGTSDPEISEDCKIPQGKYSWNELKLDSSDVNVPSGMIGRFKLDVSLIREDEKVFCSSIDLETRT